MVVYGHFNEMADGSGPLLCIRIYNKRDERDQPLIKLDKRPKMFDSKSEAQIYCDMNGYVLDNELFFQTKQIHDQIEMVRGFKFH